MAYPPIVLMTAIVGGTAVSISAMGFVLRYLAQRRISRLEGSSRDEVAQRLERLEQGMDAIATEIEKLGETNRFVTKLLANRTDPPGPQISGEPPNAP
ncbi:MAG: hypothetical protein ACRENH_03535 [Gemmatimonadaceae bacterium]